MTAVTKAPRPARNDNRIAGSRQVAQSACVAPSAGTSNSTKEK
jgi:hypothetical protein